MPSIRMFRIRVFDRVLPGFSLKMDTLVSDPASNTGRAVSVFPSYAEYQAKTERVIPVLVAERLG